MLGGALLALGGWRLIFFVNIPVGLLGIGLGWILLPRSRSRRALDRRDHLGAVLLALAAGGPLVFVSLASRLGYGNALLLAALVAGVAAAAGFVRHERRVAAPLIDLSLFRRRVFALGLGSGLISYVVLFGTLVAIPYFLAAEHTHAAVVGLELSALPIAIAIAAPIAGRFADRVSSRLLSGGALLVAGAGLLEMVLSHDTTGLVTGLVIAGLGLGAFTPTNNATIMSAAPDGHAGVVSGVLNMTRGMGAALGVAIASAVYAAGAATGGADSDPAQGLTVALTVLGAFALAGGAALLARSSPPVDGGRQRDRLGVRSGWRRGARERLGVVGETDTRETDTPRTEPEVARARWMLAREWKRASVLSLILAALTGVRAGSAQPRWDTGDLLVGLYFAGLSLLFWARGARLQRLRGIERSAAVLITSLAVGLGIGGVVVLIDIGTALGL